MYTGPPVTVVTVLGRRKSVTVSDCHSKADYVMDQKTVTSRSVTLTGVTVSGRACKIVKFSGRNGDNQLQVDPAKETTPTGTRLQPLLARRGAEPPQ